MTRARSIFQAVNLLSKSKNRDPVKWSEIYKGLHRRVILSSINNGNLGDKTISFITCKDISLVFEAFSRISKCRELVELNTTQKIAINSSEASKSNTLTHMYNEYTFGFHDLVNLYLPLTLNCVDDLDMYETYKLLRFLKILGQESYLIHNTLNKLIEKFTNQCSFISTSEICKLIKTLSTYLQQTQSTEILTPLINELNNKIMTLDINQVYEIIETLHLLHEMPCNQILYDCYIRLREDYYQLSIRQITFAISCYSKHYRYTHSYIKSLISQVSDFLVKKCSLKINDKHKLLASIDGRVVSQLFKSYSTVGYISRELFDILFDVIHLISDKLSLLNYYTIVSSLSLLQSKHNVYLYSYIDLEYDKSSLLPETYDDKLDNPIRVWLRLKEGLGIRYKMEDELRDKFEEKNEARALMLLPKENYHSNITIWWRSLLDDLSSSIERLKAIEDPRFDFINLSIKIIDLLAESGQCHVQVISQLLDLIYEDIDTLSGFTLLSLSCNLQSLQIQNLKLLERIILKFSEFTLVQSLICINLMFANSIKLEETHDDFLCKIPSLINDMKPNLIKATHPNVLLEIACYLSMNNITERSISIELIKLLKDVLSINISPWILELLDSRVSEYKLRLLNSDEGVNNTLVYSRLMTDLRSLITSSSIPIIDIIDGYECVDATYHWELESFKKLLYRIKLELSQLDIAYKAKCTINTCPIDLLYHKRENDVDNYVILCLVPDEFDTVNSNYINTCYWKCRMSYLNSLGLKVDVISWDDIETSIQKLRV